MGKVLFLPLNQNHVLIFHEIIMELNMPYAVACHDRISESRQYHTEKILKEKGISYVHLRNRVVRSENEKLGLRLRHFFQLKKEIESLLASISPTVLVLGLDNDPIARIAIGCAKRRSIRTVLVPEGLLKPHEFSRERRYVSDHGYAFLTRLGVFIAYTRYGTGGCDRILVTGRRAFEILRGVGVSEKKMVIAGMPKYDAFLREIEKADITFPASKTCLYAASTRVFENEKEVQLVRGIAESARRLGLRLIVKLHPRSVKGPQAFQGLLGGEDGAHVEVIREGYETLEILKKVDAVATISSAIVLEALMLNKECVVADYLAGRRSFGYGSYDAVHVIEKEDGILEAMRQSVHERKPYEKKKHLLEDELYRLDGRAGRRSARIIETMSS